jgi:hypothetical protein
MLSVDDGEIGETGYLGEGDGYISLSRAFPGQLSKGMPSVIATNVPADPLNTAKGGSGTRIQIVSSALVSVEQKSRQVCHWSFMVPCYGRTAIKRVGARQVSSLTRELTRDLPTKPIDTPKQRPFAAMPCAPPLFRKQWKYRRSSLLDSAIRHHSCEFTSRLIVMEANANRRRQRKRGTAASVSEITPAICSGGQMTAHLTMSFSPRAAVVLALRFVSFRPACIWQSPYRRRMTMPARGHRQSNNTAGGLGSSRRESWSGRH